MTLDPRKEQIVAELERLVSEERNPRTVGIDRKPTLAVLEDINHEDAGIPAAVRQVLPAVAAAVERIVAAFRGGGRLVYIGAGTSGRLGVLDAAECPPTFGVPETMVLGLIAGGPAAMTQAVEGAEDDEEQGALDLRAVGLSAADVVVGIAVSGRTPYVVGALRYAGSVGAATVALSCNPDALIGRHAHISIAPVVGPEVIAGSTRLKSGTAQKLVLNMLSTASMIGMGKVYENLMVEVNVTNAKLAARAVRIIAYNSAVSEDEARELLRGAGNEVKLALLMAKTGSRIEVARAALDAADGMLGRAIAALR